MKVINGIIIISVIAVFGSFSCEKEDSKEIVACGVKSPLENIVWLKTLVIDLTADTEIDSATITSYNYLESNAFYVYIHKKMQYNMPSPIFNCEGVIIFKVGGNQLNDSSAFFFNQAANPILIWSK